MNMSEDSDEDSDTLRPRVKARVVSHTLRPPVNVVETNPSPTAPSVDGATKAAASTNDGGALNDRAMSAPTFIPPKSKSNLEREGCICNWGEECLSIKAFFDKVKHPLSGFVNMDYSESCHFLNFWEAACHFLGVPIEKQDELREQHRQHKADPKSCNRARFKIASFHFPLNLVMAQKNGVIGQWLSPMKREKAEEIQCYQNRDPPADEDYLIKYNPNLGEGQGERWKINNIDMLRKAPCMELSAVREIAALVQTYPDDWKERIISKDTTTISTSMALALSGDSASFEVEMLRRQVQSLTAENQELKNENAKLRKRAAVAESHYIPKPKKRRTHQMKKKFAHWHKSLMRGSKNHKIMNSEFLSERSPESYEVTVKDSGLWSQQEFEACFEGHGTKIQPTPDNNPKSKVVVVSLSGYDEVKSLFADVGQTDIPENGYLVQHWRKRIPTLKRSQNCGVGKAKLGGVNLQYRKTKQSLTLVFTMWTDPAEEVVPMSDEELEITVPEIPPPCE